jgi:hypothetical protein
MERHREIETAPYHAHGTTAMPDGGADSKLIARVGHGVVVLVADVGGEVVDRGPAHRAHGAAVTAASALSVAAKLLFAAEVLAVLTAATAAAVMMSAPVSAPAAVAAMTAAMAATAAL